MIGSGVGRSATLRLRMRTISRQEERSHRGDQCTSGQGAPGEDRRRHHGMQARARGDRRRRRTRRSTILKQQGLAKAEKKSGRAALARADRALHPRRRPHRRPGRGELRDRLRRPAPPISGPWPTTSRCRSRPSNPSTSPKTRSPTRPGPSLRQEYGEPRPRRSRRSACSIRPSSRTAAARSAIWSMTNIAKVGENIVVRRFARFEVGADLPTSGR